MANWDSGLHWDSNPPVYYDSGPVVVTPNQMPDNRISAVLAASALANINTAITTIRTNAPFLLNLSAYDRKHLASVNEASQGVILAALNFVQQNPEAIPGTFNTAEFNKDGALLTPMQQATSAVAQLHQDFDDTLKALQGDLYAEFLDVYAFAKANNRNGAYDEFINSVKGRFKKNNHPPASPTPPGA